MTRTTTKACKAKAERFQKLCNWAEDNNIKDIVESLKKREKQQMQLQRMDKALADYRARKRRLEELRATCYVTEGHHDFF